MQLNIPGAEPGFGGQSSQRQPGQPGSLALSQAAPQAAQRVGQFRSVGGAPVVKPQQQLTQNNQMSKTFSKVPPKKYKASSQNKTAGGAKSSQNDKPKKDKDGQNNQLLYKIKYINTTQQKSLPTQGQPSGRGSNRASLVSNGQRPGGKTDDDTKHGS